MKRETLIKAKEIDQEIRELLGLIESCNKRDLKYMIDFNEEDCEERTCDLRGETWYLLIEKLKEIRSVLEEELSNLKD